MSELSASVFIIIVFIISGVLSAADFGGSGTSTVHYSFDSAYTVNIDCGGSANFTSKLGRQWLSDRYFSAGSPGVVAEPHRFPQQQERTLRFFPPTTSGKKNCYSIPASPGRYYLRTFTVYDNYDAKLRPPSFDVSVEGTLVFSWRSPWPEPVPRSGAYSDLILSTSDGDVDLCFYTIATDPPLVASIELARMDPLAYDSATTGVDLLLVNYGRLSSGSGIFGPGFTNDSDPFGRVWQSDSEYRNPNVRIKALSPAGRRQVHGTDRPPNYFPNALYLSSITTTSDGDTLEYLLPVDTRLDYLLWFHFAEIDSGINGAGQRIFDVLINGDNVARIDIFKAVGGFTAFEWHQVVQNLTSSPLSIQLVPIVGRPVISGLENYAMVPIDMSTIPKQAAAMRELKKSLRIPDRMGWNGDPCAPSTWDAWEGVTCHHSEDRRNLVITMLDLGSQGLKGYISDQISLLANLVSLNLSSNSLGGTLPLGLGKGSLAKLDLSSNQFSGLIPEGLGSSNLHLVLLNNNELEGQVPEGLYSIGVRGGIIDLSSNKGLCGVPSLPACPFFWEKGNLSRHGKIAIGLSLGIVTGIILLIICVCCIRRGRHDYDFGLPQDLISVAAKRNRYQRQKLMLIEMETRDSSGYPATLASY